jgi:hypothetical protein
MSKNDNEEDLYQAMKRRDRERDIPMGIATFVALGIFAFLAYSCSWF